MPGKKMKKIAANAEKAGCGCPNCGPFVKFEMYLLVFLGALGLLSAMNLLTFGPNNLLFQYTWSVLVLVVGFTRLLGLDY